MSSSEEEDAAALGTGSAVIGRTSGVLGTLFPNRRAWTTRLGRVVGSVKNKSNLTEKKRLEGRLLKGFKELILT
jgi:hypothetical protein